MGVIIPFYGINTPKDFYPGRKSMRKSIDQGESV